MEKEFAAFINKHRRIIYKVCNLYISDTEDRKDLFQEIVLQLWKSFPGFRNESQRSTWMYRVALNTAISNFRKESRKPERLALSDREFEMPDLSNVSDQNERIQMLQQAIAQLTDIEKAIIMLYLEEKTYDEISEIMGITRTNTGVKINRIKSKLELIIKKNNYEY
jgi:RNA polymerase sigma-70 factor (ECF subfamily)